MYFLEKGTWLHQISLSKRKTLTTQTPASLSHRFSLSEGDPAAVQPSEAGLSKYGHTFPVGSICPVMGAMLIHCWSTLGSSCFKINKTMKSQAFIYEVLCWIWDVWCTNKLQNYEVNILWIAKKVKLIILEEQIEKYNSVYISWECFILLSSISKTELHHYCWERKGNDSADILVRIFLIWYGNPHIVWMSIYAFHSAFWLRFYMNFPRWHFPIYHHAALQVTCTYPAGIFKRTSLTLESAGRDWIPLHILSPSLPCQPVYSGGRARCSTQQFHSSAAPEAPVCAHKLSERGGKRTARIHAAPVFSQSSVLTRQGTFNRPRLR